MRLSPRGDVIVDWPLLLLIRRGDSHTFVEEPLYTSTFKRLPDVQVPLAVDRHIVGNVELPAPVPVMAESTHDLERVAQQNPHSMVRPRPERTDIAAAAHVSGNGFGHVASYWNIGTLMFCWPWAPTAFSAFGPKAPIATMVRSIAPTHDMPSLPR